MIYSFTIFASKTLASRLIPPVSCLLTGKLLQASGSVYQWVIPVCQTRIHCEVKEFPLFCWIFSPWFFQRFCPLFQTISCNRNCCAAEKKVSEKLWISYGNTIFPLTLNFGDFFFNFPRVVKNFAFHQSSLTVPWCFLDFQVFQIDCWNRQSWGWVPEFKTANCRNRFNLSFWRNSCLHCLPPRKKQALFKGNEFHSRLSKVDS